MNKTLAKRWWLLASLPLMGSLAQAAPLYAVYKDVDGYSDYRHYHEGKSQKSRSHGVGYSNYANLGFYTGIYSSETANKKRSTVTVNATAYEGRQLRDPSAESPPGYNIGQNYMGGARSQYKVSINSSNPALQGKTVQVKLKYALYTAYNTNHQSGSLCPVCYVTSEARIGIWNKATYQGVQTVPDVWHKSISVIGQPGDADALFAVAGYQNINGTPITITDPTQFDETDTTRFKRKKKTLNLVIGQDYIINLLAEVNLNQGGNLATSPYSIDRNLLYTTNVDALADPEFELVAVQDNSCTTNPSLCDISQLSVSESAIDNLVFTSVPLAPTGLLLLAGLPWLRRRVTTI